MIWKEMNLGKLGLVLREIVVVDTGVCPGESGVGRSHLCKLLSSMLRLSSRHLIISKTILTVILSYLIIS
jgi:hypothetical protein